MKFFKEPNGNIRWSDVVLALDVPDVSALSRLVDSSLNTTTEVTLHKATSFLEVYAVAKDIYLTWGTEDATASNFDAIIPAGQVRFFGVPNGVTAVNFIEREASATLILVEK
jgi:hypothetical protein